MGVNSVNDRKMRVNRQSMWFNDVGEDIVSDACGQTAKVNI